ncbi:MAG TPA: succinate dehydrogenase assembly factor 2 [Alphaproteobacteria bacterium]|nr:succinate dehydrogenase assembly factor 2 [Alphaproteobacteria bacterium]
MSDPLDIRRKRLAFRAWHRGLREMDLLLGHFADRHLAGLSADQLDRFEAILAVGDPELFAWVMGHEPVPAGFETDVLDMIRNFKITA